MLRERIQDVNDYEPARYSTSIGVSPYLLGALAGVAIALLLAPQPGRDSRSWIADKARRLRGLGLGEDEFGGKDRDFGADREYRSRYGENANAG